MVLNWKNIVDLLELGEVIWGGHVLKDKWERRETE